MPLLVPFPLRWAWSSGVSCHRQRELHGSGISCMLSWHTGWQVDFASKPGVASGIPNAWECCPDPEGGGTGVLCWGGIEDVQAGCAKLLLIFGSRHALCEVLDGRDRFSTGFWQLPDRLLATCSWWWNISRFLWEAASNLISEDWIRDLSLGAFVVSQLAHGDAAFWKKHLEGRLAWGGHFQRQEDKGYITETFDWALLSVFLNLAGGTESDLMGSFAAGLWVGVGIRLPRAHGIFERELESREKVKTEDERLAAGGREELVLQVNFQSELESIAGVRRFLQSELDPEGSNGGIWSRSTVWFSGSSSQGSARRLRSRRPFISRRRAPPHLHRALRLSAPMLSVAGLGRCQPEH